GLAGATELKVPEPTLGRLLVERRGVLAAGVAGVCGAAIWANSAGQSYATGLGETRNISFSDGSHVLLDACSMIRVTYGRELRRLDLVRGRLGLFPVQDPGRPFVVLGSGRRVLAIGSLDVSCLANTFTVTAVDGLAFVQSPGQATVRLDRGERLRSNPDGRPAKDRPSLAVATAWRTGQLIFSDDSLDAAVLEVNRYNRKPVVLEDAALGELRVSGSYNARQGEDFARSVATLFNLSLVEQPDKMILRRTIAS
ncbi:MAG: FecR domain-containing protein, partial [Caulobacteraceae bacterium]